MVAVNPPGGREPTATKRAPQSTDDDPGPSAFVLLPAIDLRGGRVVRLRTGDFEQETVYGDDPVEVALGFAANGAEWLHVVDLDGAREGSPQQASVVSAIVASVAGRMRVEVGGGLRDQRTVEAVLATGAARAVLGTTALEDPGLVGRLVATHGPHRLAVALDVREGMALGAGWRADAPSVAVGDALSRIADEGVRTLIVTAIARDGLLQGPDLELLGRLIAMGRGDIIASGGISSTDDVLAARQVGCTGAIVGRALYEGRLDLSETLDALRSDPGPPEVDQAPQD